MVLWSVSHQIFAEEPTPTPASLMDYWRNIGRIPGPILQNMVPSDEGVSSDGGGAGGTPAPSPSTTGYPYPPVTPGNVLPPGPPQIPAGACTTGLNTALNNLNAVASQVIPVYQQASTESGIPWEIFAAIHYVETGGSFAPNRTLTSGTKLGELEEDGVHTYYTLIDSARAAATIFKQKYPSSGPYNDFRKLVTAFAEYNGPGNRQCNGNNPKPQTRYTGCPRLYEYEDHLYPLACYDERHKEMWYVYCGFQQECPPISTSNPNGRPYSPNRIGTLALIAGIQQRYAQAAPTSPPSPTSPPGTTTLAPTAPPAQPGNLRYFNQCDPAFQVQSYGNCQKDGETVPFLCAAGCVPTSVAQVIASYADSGYTPVRAANSMLANPAVLSCDGSSSQAQIRVLNGYAVSIERTDIISSSGDLAADAARLKPFFSQGWTALARVAYKRTMNTNTRGHYVWITQIDANNNILVYDPYFVNDSIMGPGARPPINLNGLLRGQYPDRSFTSLDITQYILVRKK